MNGWDSTWRFAGYVPENAQDLFINRGDERRTFESALSRHVESLKTDYDLTSRENPRHNVLVYCGKGGVGKTELSRRLEAWVRGDLDAHAAWGSKPVADGVATLRVDLHDSAGALHVDHLLIEVREELGESRPRWSAFDYAFTAYWAVHHPNEPVPIGSRRRGRLRQAAQASAADLLGLAGVPGASLGTFVVSSVMDRIRRGRLRHLAESLAPRVADIVAALARDDTQQLRTSLASLLAAELDAQLPSDRPLVIAFADATERLSDEGMALLNSVAWQLPHMLWVMTGRDRLRWAEDRLTTVPFRGPTAWPGLVRSATTELRQHLIGNLSDADARAFLRNARARDDLSLSDEQIEVVIRQSDGLPLWLDVVVQLAQDASASGRELCAADLTGPFDDLVKRLLQDLDDEEQRLVRAACLVRRFDTRLLASGANVSIGAAERFVQRPLIGHEPMPKHLPYRLHDEVRRVVRAAGVHVPGGWAALDWQAAGERIANLLRSDYDDTPDASRRFETLEQVLEVGLNAGIEVAWLRRAVSDLPSLYTFAERTAADIEAPETWAEWFCRLMRAWAPGVTPAARRGLLAEYIESGSPSDLADMARRFMAYSSRSSGTFDTAISVFEFLDANRPSDHHRHQRILSLIYSCRFREAADLLGKSSSLSESRRAGLMASLAYSHGRLAEAVQLKQIRLDQLTADHQFRVAGETLGALHRWRAMLEPGHEADALAALDMPAAQSNPPAIRGLLAAAAFSCAGVPNRVRQHVERSRDISEFYGLRRESPYTVAPLVFDALVRHDSDALRAAHDLVLAQGDRKSRPWRIVGFWLESAGLPVPEPLVDWLEPTDVVRGRWLELINSRRSHLDSERESQTR